jgi:hypothetical protein
MNKLTVTLKVLIIFITTFHFVKCSKPEETVYYQEDNSLNFNDSLTFIEAGSFQLPLDSATAITSSSINFYESPDKQVRLFSMISSAESFISIFNYDTRELIRKITLQVDGPDGVGPGNGFLSHYIISEDSILICNSYSFKVFILNRQGHVLKKYDVLDKYIPGQLNAIPLASTEMPLQVRNNKVFIMGTLNDPTLKDQAKSKMVIILDLKTGESHHSFNRSSVYNIGNWGRNYLLLSFYGTYNSHSGNFIYSFSADPFIYETNHDDILIKHYAGSKYFKEIYPMDPDKSKEFTNKESKVFDFTSPAFYRILYDPYRRLYYRSAFLPITREEFENPEIRYNRQETIIILDEAFKKVGEYNVPRGKLAFYNFFISQEGLHILLKPELHSSEDSLTYMVFKVTPKN